MSFAEHAIAQVFREVADEIISKVDMKEGFALRYPEDGRLEIALVLRRIAHKLSPKPPGEK